MLMGYDTSHEQLENHDQFTTCKVILQPQPIGTVVAKGEVAGAANWKR